MPPLHASATFEFDLALAYDVAAPLFGAKQEQKWAAGWEPHFIHPTPADDVEGAVFRTEPGTRHERLWITTVFDLGAGHVQYVYVLRQAMITRIDIRLARLGANRTGVSVTYERTALDPAANDDVLAASERDRANGPEWRREIENHARSVK